MNKKIYFFALLSFAATVALTTSCSKDNSSSTPTGTDAAIASDNAYADNTFNDVQTISDLAYDKDKTKAGEVADSSLIPSGTTVTVDSLITRTITIDFGSGVVCGDGRTRSGKILVSFNGPYRASGTVITHTFDNYKVDGNKVTGTKVVTNEGLADTTLTVGVFTTHKYMKFSVIEIGSVIKANGDTITWSSDRTRKWMWGWWTRNWKDDVYAISGSGICTTKNGSCNTLITKDLIKPVRYIHILSGEVEITKVSLSGIIVITLTYNNGTWTNPWWTWNWGKSSKAKVKSNDSTSEIVLN
jgi:hypothetical protein